MLEEQRGAKKQHLILLEQPACAKKIQVQLLLQEILNHRSVFLLI